MTYKIVFCNHFHFHTNQINITPSETLNATIGRHILWCISHCMKHDGARGHLGKPQCPPFSCFTKQRHNSHQTTPTTPSLQLLLSLYKIQIYVKRRRPKVKVLSSNQPGVLEFVGSLLRLEWISSIYIIYMLVHVYTYIY